MSHEPLPVNASIYVAIFEEGSPVVITELFQQARDEVRVTFHTYSPLDNEAIRQTLDFVSEAADEHILLQERAAQARHDSLEDSPF